MGIDVRVESEFGEELASVGDPTGLTRKLLPEMTDEKSACLRFIDPYGNTIFNYLQIPFIKEELALALEFIKDTELNAHAKAILVLAEAAEAERHLYLKFCGD